MGGDDVSNPGEEPRCEQCYSVCYGQAQVRAELYDGFIGDFDFLQIGVLY